MNPASLEITVTVLLGAVLIDFVFGDPRSYLNPAALMRKTVSFFDPFFRPQKNRVATGALFALFLCILFAIPFTGLLIVISRVFVVEVVVGLIVLKGLFSVTGLSERINPIIKSLEDGAIGEAAMLASRIVKRDLTGQDAPQIASAVVESISNSLLNDVVSPLFYFSIFGIIGALVAKVVDTLDASIGQRNRRNIDFGRWPAIFHTVINYAPARITAFLIMLGSELLNYRVSTLSFKSTRLATDSPGEGWTMGAMASSLNLRMEKVGHYVLNDDGFAPTVGDVRRAVRVYYVSFYLMLVVSVIPIILILYWSGFSPLN